ncbi:UNVERIFIED_ORG: hypothetical protein GGE11_003257 [Mycolicibacterium obuense]
MTDAPATEGLLTAHAAVVLTGPAARAALDCVLIAIRTRRANKLPESSAHIALAHALQTAVAVNGQSDVRKTVTAHADLMPTVPVDQAAERLGLSHRHTRRIAPRLGGRRSAGRWFLDEQAIREHLEGK